MRWRWSLPLLAGLLFLLGVFSQEEDAVSKRVYLKTPASFVNLTSESWKLTESIENVLVAIRFTAQSRVGRVLSTKFIKTDGNVEAELVVALEGGQLQIDLFDSNHESILIKPLMNIYMNESMEHSVAVKINAQDKTLSFSVEHRSEHVAEITKEIQWTEAEVLTTLGGGPQALIGCVALVALQITEGDLLAHVIVVSQNEIDKCSTEQECAQRNCGRGRCLPLEVATCDCYGTSKSGPNCANDPRTIELNNSGDDADLQPASVVFTPWKEDQQVSRLAMEFKFKSTEEGVLMYGSLEGGGSLKMFVVGSLGTLDISDHKPLNFSLAPNKEFHYVGLFFKEEELRFSVDGILQATSLNSALLLTSVVFGSSPPANGVAELGLTACLRNMYFDHLDVLDLHFNKDPRVFTPKPLKTCSNSNDISSLPGQKLFAADQEIFDDGSDFEDDNDEEEDAEISTAGLFGGGSNNKNKEPIPCEKAQEYKCRNGATCLRGEKRPQCLCPSGFGGLNCQFSLFPRTCSEAVRFHRIPEGPVRLDVDGSRPLSPSVADCRDRVTYIPHDMPADTVIRAAEDQNHGLFVISYRDFPPAKLEHLVSISGDCRQQINYKCNHAPLNFVEKRTWFRVAHKNSTVTQLDEVPNGCQCIDTGCANQGKCNCDADGITSDEGVLRGMNSAVTSIVSLRREGDVSGKMTIGALECTGTVGDSHALRFRRPQQLRAGEWIGDALSFQFRSGDSAAVLFSVEGSDLNEALRVEMIDGHTLKAITKEGDIVLESQAKLNDTKWHLLVVEWSEGELRFSVDATSVFMELSAHPSGTIVLGHPERGLIGCIRSLLLSDASVSLQQAAIASGVDMDKCEDSCTASTCRNGAECHENFAFASAECSCRYPRVQSGADCSIDLNADSSVSFHGGFLKYEELPSPLTSSWILSFRTDQANALLLYVHDQNNNFLQVHVRDEVNVTLSLNNGPVVHSCSVQAPTGTEYGDMRWVQVYIDHGPAGSTLTVEEEACTIRASRRLASVPQKTFQHWNPELVIPPVGLEDVHKEFVYTFFGGVERATDEDGEERTLRAEYGALIPDLLGCLRGAKVGEEIVDLRHTSRGVRPDDPTLVRIGCDVRCESLSCHNGGHCSVAWKNYDPSAVKTTCDCSRTSYSGPSCLQDDGITFTQPQSANFDIGAVLQRYLEPTKPPAQTFKFAFSAQSSIYRQMIATIYFDDSSEFEVLINKNGSLHVGISYADGRSTAVTLKGNFSDGYRHFFVSHFASDQPTRVSVDGARRDFGYRGRDNLDLFRSRRLWLGGQRVPPAFESGIPPKMNLDGCISNVNMNLGVHVLDLWPLSYMENSSHSYGNLTVLQPPGQASRGSCAAFRVPNIPTLLGNIVSLPVWETNFQRMEYLSDEILQTEKEEGGIPWILIIIAILLVLLLLLLIGVVVCLCRKGHKDSAPQNISLDEREPLRRTEFPQTPPMTERKPHSNYAIPPPDIQLPTSPRTEPIVDSSKRSESVLSQPSWHSSTTAYFTAQEDFSDPEDFDRTLTPGSDVPTIFEDEISRPTGFDRSSPQRMSSFRDSSAPVGSPLYVPDTPRRLRPVALPQPPPRNSN